MNFNVKKILSLPFIVLMGAIGFLLGVMMISLWQNNLFFQEQVLSSDFIYEINNLYVDKRALFFLCLKKRLCAFFIMLLLSTTIWNVAFVLLFFVFQGFAIGSIVEILMIRYGWQGFAIYFLMVFPQCLCYLWGYFMLGQWCLNKEKNRNQRGMEPVGLGRVLVAFCINLLGIFIESVFSLKIFSFIFRI